jgi:hypothetical protein
VFTSKERLNRVVKGISRTSSSINFKTKIMAKKKATKKKASKKKKASSKRKR